MAEKIDLKGLSMEQLQEELTTTEQAYNSMKFNHAVAPLENPSELNNLRKQVARIKTEIRAKELETSDEARDRIRARRKRLKKIKK